MLDFKAEMHQIRFRLGLCPKPRGGKGRGKAGRGGEGLALSIPTFYFIVPPIAAVCMVDYA